MHSRRVFPPPRRQRAGFPALSCRRFHDFGGCAVYGGAPDDVRGLSNDLATPLWPECGDSGRRNRSFRACFASSSRFKTTSTSLVAYQKGLWHFFCYWLRLFCGDFRFYEWNSCCHLVLQAELPRLSYECFQMPAKFSIYIFGGRIFFIFVVGNEWITIYLEDRRKIKTSTFLVWFSRFKIYSTISTIIWNLSKIYYFV